MIRLIGGLFSLGAMAAIAALAAVAMVVWMYDRDLPSGENLAAYQPKTLSRVYSGEGALIAEFARERRIFVPIENIPDEIKNAFISAEDKNFYSHPGIDAWGVARAMVSNLQALRSGGGRLQGASTITQQVMKNFLLSSDYSIERKIKEAILSVRMEQTLSKDRILELYLNEIFLGQNAYGVAAAAQRYFGKTLESLTLSETAYLAALPKAPSDLHPIRQKSRATERRNYVLREMEENGHISAAEREAAQAEPLTTLLDGELVSEVETPPAPDYFSEEVRRQLSAELGEDRLYEGGLTVRATVDPRLQRIAAAALREKLQQWSVGGFAGPLAQLPADTLSEPGRWRSALAATADLPRDLPGWRAAVVLAVEPDGARIGVEGVEQEGSIPFASVRDWARPRREQGRLGPKPARSADVWAAGDVVMVSQGDTPGAWRMRQTPELQGAVMAMDARTGRVLAMQGGYSHMASVFNRATQAARQPGSAFKPFVYATALERGYPPNTIIYDLPIVIRQNGEVWKPQNSSGTFLGPVTMRRGLEQSRNLMTIRLAQEVGLDSVAALAGRLGVYDDMPPLLSYALGAGETTLYKLMTAYAIVANGGKQVTPTVVDRVEDRRGETIFRHDARLCAGCDAGPEAGPPELIDDAPRSIDAITAYQLTSMLRGVVTRGTARAPFKGVGLPVAGKTGTTNDAKDVWFIGYTPEMVVGCFIGYDTPRPIGRRAFGGTVCAPVVAQFLREAYADGRRAGSFKVPRGAIIQVVDGVREVFRPGDPIYDPAVIGEGENDVAFFAGGEDFPLELGGFEGPDSGADGGESAPVAPAGGGGRPAPSLPAIGDDLGAPGGLY